MQAEINKARHQLDSDNRFRLGVYWRLQDMDGLVLQLVLAERKSPCFGLNATIQTGHSKKISARSRLVSYRVVRDTIVFETDKGTYKAKWDDHMPNAALFGN